MVIENSSSSLKISTLFVYHITFWYDIIYDAVRKIDGELSVVIYYLPA